MDFGLRKQVDDTEERMHRAAAILECAAEGIISIDECGIVTSINRAASVMFGYKRREIVGENVRMLMPAPIAEQHDAYLLRYFQEGGEKVVGGRREVEGQRRDGSVFPMSLAVREIPKSDGMIGFVGVIHDLTEQRALESQLLQAQKLESLGRLAAGVAHEINTPSQYVGDNLEFLDTSFAELGDLLEKYRTLQAAAEAGHVSPKLLSEVAQAAQTADVEFLEEEIPRALLQAREGVGRVTEIVRAMKEFSHPGSAEKQPIDLNRAIESTLTVARNEWKYVADVETEFDAELPMVPCLAGEFNQVVLSIVVNAAHALAGIQSEGDGDKKGQIRIRTRQESGEWAVIEISDDGPGIPETVRSKVFDPFFTTKEVGKGTGQGLAIAHSVVVTKHGGRIEVESEIGHGATSRIWLPLYEQEQSSVSA